MKKIKAVIKEVKALTEDISQFVFVLDGNLEFKPWQFVMIEIENWDEKPVKRAYSVVSYNSDTNELVLCIQNVNGIWTTWLFSLSSWDEVSLMWSFGHFVLHNDKPNIYFFATWIWMPPIKCLLEELFRIWTDKTVHLYFGLRYEKDIYYKDFLDGLVKNHSNFSYDICISREDVKWCYSGYVTKKIYEDDIDWQNSEAYYCWSVPVSKDLKQKTLELWLEKSCFYSEAF